MQENKIKWKLENYNLQDNAVLNANMNYTYHDMYSLPLWTPKYKHRLHLPGVDKKGSFNLCLLLKIKEDQDVKIKK